MMIHTRHQQNDIIAMDALRYISFDPNVRNGQPCIRGTRITVSDILEYLGSGMSVEQILDDFPALTEPEIRAATLFSAGLFTSYYSLISVLFKPHDQFDEWDKYLFDILKSLQAIGDSKWQFPFPKESSEVQKALKSAEAAVKK